MSDAIKRQIVADVLAHKPEITVNHPNAPTLFRSAMDECPKALAYIAGVGYSAPLMMRGFTFKITYSQTDVPAKNIFRADSAADVEDILHRAISGIMNPIIIAAPMGVPVMDAYSSFNVAYNGFYSNLVGTGVSSWNLSGYSFAFVRFEFKYRIGKVKLLMMERDVDKEVDRLARLLFSPDMRPETKAYVAHNYLARNVEYWLKEDANPLEMSYRQSAYGALINKKCVCQGYAEAYKRLLDSQGIANYVLCGKVKGSAVHHAWNAVSFNGRDFYHVDVTWDSRGGGLSSQQYFCKTDEDMRPTRIWTRRAGVICNSTTNIGSIAREDILYNRGKYISQGIDKNNF